MIYDISHRTTVSYASPVTISQQLLHLAPRATPNQILRNFSLLVEPAPTASTDGVDFFGNPTTYLTLDEAHERLTIVASSRMEISLPSIPNPSDTMAWERVRATLVDSPDAQSLDAHQFAFDSAFTTSREAFDYARASFQTGRPVLEAAIDLTSRIFGDFKYEGGVTDINTPVDKVFADRRGVCQDFAHLQIACLRALGLPARYVSGYLRTHPPEGQERRIGADASHAWLSIWVPEAGWIDLDPTNDMIPRDEHITIAWGRDYGDVSPINGMMIGGGDQRVEVAVDVRPLSEGAREI